MRSKLLRRDIIFWICIIGAVTCLILEFFHNSPYGELSLAFLVGGLLYLYRAIFDLYGAIGEIRGRLTSLPTSEEVRRIIKEELASFREG